jgi:hypothetical protein
MATGGKNMLKTLISIVLLLHLVRISTFADGGNDVLYLAVPKKPVAAGTQVQRFAAVCVRLQPVRSDGAAPSIGRPITALRTEPRIPAFIHSPNRGVDEKTIRKTIAQRYETIPTDAVAAIVDALTCEMSEDENLRFEPLFPLMQPTFWVQADQIITLAVPRTKQDVLIERNLVRQLETERNRVQTNDVGLEERFVEFCAEMAVPVKKVWYISELNILVILSDDQFGGLMSALFSVAS